MRTPIFPFLSRVPLEFHLPVFVLTRKFFTGQGCFSRSLCSQRLLFYQFFEEPGLILYFTHLCFFDFIFSRFFPQALKFF